MAIYKITYDYNVNYTARIEAKDEDEAWTKFHNMDFIGEPVEGEWDLLDTADLEEEEED
jgi:hypothetical protein